MPDPPVMPTGTFAEALDNEEATLALAPREEYCLELFFNGDSKGYLCIDEDGYCYAGQSKQKYSPYIHSDNKTYYEVNGGTWNGYWLSYWGGPSGYCGPYPKSGRVDWKLSTHMCRPGVGCVSLYSDDNTYVYCNDNYNILDVRKDKSC